MTQTQPATPQSAREEQLQLRVAHLEAELRKEQARCERVQQERDRLRVAYEQLRLELELLKRRIFVAKAERVDTAQLELEFAGKLLALGALGHKLGQETAPADEPGPEAQPPGNKGPRSRPRGRRDLSETDLPVQRIELCDPALEELCAAGKAERIGFEESSKLAWQRGGHRRLVMARVKYRLTGETPETTDIVTAPLPKETLSRCLAAPSLLAHILVDKHCDGLPLYRIEDRFTRDGVKLDRGTMSRWLEDAGATFGATVVQAARDEAMRTAFCLATDATGVAIQPVPSQSRSPCRRGHFFVLLADRDHVFFEYTPKETSQVVGTMFRGFSGYIQADAKSVYNLLFVPPEQRPKPPEGEEPDNGVRLEVGCWSHARRKFWESAITKCTVAREALYRIRQFFEREEQWRDRAPAQRQGLRDLHLRPLMLAFFAWAAVQYELVRDQRGLLRSALGYALRQKEALLRPLDDGRLVLDNNRSERALRTIAVGRKAWLFCGSDDHAQAAGHILSLIASARLHGLDPEAYLRDLLRVLAYWPKDRYLELAPKYWTRTRDRLNPAQLQAELGPLTVPPPLPTATEEQTTPR